MGVLETFFDNPADEGSQERLLEACRAWINAVFEAAGAGDRPPLNPEIRQRVEEATLKNLREETFRRIRGPDASTAENESPRASKQTGRTAYDITDGVLTRSQDLESLDGFKRFVNTLTCFHMMQLCDKDKEVDQRRFAAEYFISYLIPTLDDRVERLSGDGYPKGGRDEGGSQDSPLAAEAVLRLLADRPITTFLKTEFATPGKAVGYVTRSAKNAAKGVLKKARRPTNVIREDDDKMMSELAECKVEHREIEAGRREFGRALLDELWPFTLKVAQKFPNSQGESLLLWMMLGGVSHRRVDQERNKQASYLVQRELIEAVLSRFTRHAIERTYENGVERVADSLRKGYRERLEQLLASRISEIGWLSDANRAEFLKTLKDRKLGFQAFKAQSQQTCRMIEDKRIQLEKPLATVARKNETAGHATHRFKAIRPTPSRDDPKIPAITKFICENISQCSEGKSRKQRWLDTMDSFSGKE